MKTLQAIKNERAVNIKELQKSPSRYLRSMTHILRGNKILGCFLDVEAFENLVEDLEAAETAYTYKRFLAFPDKTLVGSEIFFYLKIFASL